MKKFRRITTLLLAVMLIAAMCVPAYADNGMTRAVIGADLNEDQVAAVYQAFGVERGSCTEMKVTNAEERQYLRAMSTAPSSAPAPSPASMSSSSATAAAWMSPPAISHGAPLRCT